MGARPAGAAGPRWDFFISYTAVDHAWAEWIAWQLEEAGHQVLFQAWDFVPGSHWTSRMREGISEAERTIAVLSHAYLDSVYGRVEWQAVFRADPNGFTRKLVPVRIEDCERPDILGEVVSFDLFDLPAAEARQHLLDTVGHIVSGRAKPDSAPSFPSDPSDPGPPRDRLLTTDRPAPSPPAGALEAEPAFPGTTPSRPAPPSELVPIGRAALVRGWLRSRWRYVTSLSFVAAVTSVILALTFVEDDNGTPSSQPATSAPRSPAATARSLDTAHTPKAARSLAFAPGQRTVLASGGYDETVQLWDVTEPSDPASLGEPLRGFEGPVYSVAFAPGNAALLATGSENQSLLLWNVADPARPQQLGSVPVPDRLLHSVAFAPDDATLLAAGGTDRQVRLWDVTDPAHPDLVGEPLTGHSDEVRSVAFSPDGNILATASSDRTVQLWDTTHPGQPGLLARLTEHTDQVTSVAFQPDGRTLATSSLDKTVRLWDVTDPPSARQLFKLELTDPVWMVAFAPDGRTLSSGDGEKVRLWDVTDPAHPDLVGEPLTGHTDDVRSLAFAPDGQVLASGDNIGTVRLWPIVRD